MAHTAKKALLGLLFSVMVSTGALAATETYYTDQGHTQIRFGWSHVGISNQRGGFTKASGKLVLDPDNVERSTLTVTVDATSLATGFGPLDKHLKSKDFLEVETYPEITFVSTAVKRTGDDTAEVTGDLTIHGVTKPVTLKTKLTHRGAHPLRRTRLDGTQHQGRSARRKANHRAARVIGNAHKKLPAAA